jgi:hypothetical protein
MPTIYEVTDESGGTIDWFPTKKEALKFASHEGHPRDGVWPLKYNKPTREEVCRILRVSGERQ